MLPTNDNIGFGLNMRMFVLLFNKSGILHLMIIYLNDLSFDFHRLMSSLSLPGVGTTWIRSMNPWSPLSKILIRKCFN